MGFDAGKAVEPLTWDFTKITGDSDDKGTVPEPSEQRVYELNARVRKLVREALEELQQEEGPESEVEEPTTDDFLRAVATLDQAQESALVLGRKIDETYAEFCKGSPTFEQIRKLPHRHRIAFYRWLNEELSPEASSAATSTRANLRLVRGA